MTGAIATLITECSKGRSEGLHTDAERELIEIGRAARALMQIAPATREYVSNGKGVRALRAARSLMSRHDPKTTPPEKRRAAKGSAVARLPSGAHTAESYAAFVALKARDGLSDVETVRKALEKAANGGGNGDQ